MNHRRQCREDVILFLQELETKFHSNNRAPLVRQVRRQGTTYYGLTKKGVKAVRALENATDLQLLST